MTDMKMVMRMFCITKMTMVTMMMILMTKIIMDGHKNVWH